MANAKKTESFEDTWKRCRTNKYRSDRAMSADWVNYNTHYIIRLLEGAMSNCKNPHKIDLYKRRIAYIKMMLLLEY